MSADAAQSDSSNPPQRGTARAWLQLFRVPNLLTVPGDPIAGVFLAAAAANAAIPASAMFAAMAVSLLLYGAGLLQNDYFDLPEDRRERPRRPLPSGAVRPVYAIAVAVAMMIAAVAVSFCISPAGPVLAVGVAAVVTGYNRFLKRVAVVGPLAMGVCRGLSLLLGAACLGWGGVTTLLSLLGAVGATLYIAAVTQIARRETRAGPVGPVRFLPGGIALALLASIEAVLLLHGRPASTLGVSLALAVLAAGATFAIGLRLPSPAEPPAIQAAIGKFIRALLLIQAALAAVVPPIGIGLAIALVVAFAFAGILRRWFYQS